jgi:ribosomal protein L19|tara:strand:- start:2033 stop:2602 length:570 start_codon:yes stop_codon:yes gene_type:complete
MNNIPSFEEFNNQQLVKESYDLLEGSVSYDDLNDILNEGLFSFIKGIFINPGKKRKLRKLGDQLFKIKVQIQKMDIEQNDISKLEDELKSKDSNYTADPALSVAVNAEDKKKQALQNKEGIIIDQMDSVAGDNETLTKYVNKVKLEVRMKANEATIKLADDEMERILQKIQKKDAKEVQSLDKVLSQAA